MSVNFNSTTPSIPSTGSPVTFQNDGSGNISAYVTAVPFATVVDLTAQTAAISPTTLYAVPASGLYRVSFYAKITTAGGVSSVLGGSAGFQLSYTDPTDSTTPTITSTPLNSDALNANTTTTVDTGMLIVSALVSTNISYSYDYTSVGSAMAYKLSIRVEPLS